MHHGLRGGWTPREIDKQEIRKETIRIKCIIRERYAIPQSVPSGIRVWLTSSSPSPSNLSLPQHYSQSFRFADRVTTESFHFFQVFLTSLPNLQEHQNFEWFLH